MTQNIPCFIMYVRTCVFQLGHRVLEIWRENNFLILINFLITFFDRENFLMTFGVRRRYPEIIFRKFFGNSTTLMIDIEI